MASKRSGQATAWESSSDKWTSPLAPSASRLFPQTLEAGLLFRTPVSVIDRMCLRQSPNGASHGRQRTEEHQLRGRLVVRARHADRLDAEA